MPLFFRKDRLTGDGSPSKSSKNRITTTCPECGADQSESSFAVSTYCRTCGSHYKISEGKAVPKPNSSSALLTAAKNRLPEPNVQATPTTRETGQSTARTSKHTPPSATEPDSPPKSSRKLFQNKASQREVSCFECNKTHFVLKEASSTLCPGCGAYIGLKNFDIRENWNRRIQTRGDVTIHKKAVVTGITIRCHHLTVLGTLTGGVDCSGDFVIQNHGKIMGKVRCKRLIIEQKAQVEFANPVECEDATIDGQVTGNFTCTGKLHLKKKATLHGDIRVGTMAVDEGARHQGNISIGQ